MIEYVHIFIINYDFFGFIEYYCRWGENLP